MPIRYLWLVCCWLPFVLTLRAQPGGGGGIGFQQLYGREGSHLVPLSWKAAGVRVFTLGKPINDTYSIIDQEDYAPYFERLQQPVRLLLIHRADTMILDLDHLWQPNGVGAWHQLDSLVVLPGYFHYADTVGSMSFVRTNGLTPHTVALMRARHQLRYQPHARLDFLAANRLSFAYYLALSRHWLLEQQPDSALAALSAAEARPPARQWKPLLAGRRARAYQQLGNYALAVRWVTQALTYAPQSTQSPDRWEDYYSVEQMYQQRQHLYLLLHDYRAALADYDALAALEALQSRREERAATPAIDRALFLADSLHQPAEYAVTVRLLRLRLPATPASTWPCERRLRTERAYYVTDTAPAYFRLGIAEYRASQFAAAFQHWYLSLAEGQAFEKGGAPYVAHFDSLLARWPQQPLLWLGRAIAHLHYSQVRVPGGWQSARGDYAASLRDLDRAEQLGYTAVEVNYYRALAFKGLERWAEMNKQLDVAIRKAPQVGELYLLRHEARNALKRVEYSDPNDPDELKYRQLCSEAR